MKKTLIAAAITVSIALALAGCGGANKADGPIRGNKGPILDRILLNANTQQDIALKDVSEGKSDIFNYATDGAAFKSLPDDVKAKLDPYAVTGSSYDSLYLNPYPNAAPYTGKVDGKTVFNPFAIQAVRFAINDLIDRQKVVDEILVGAGVPMISAVCPGQPNSTRYDLGAAKLGLTANGDEKKAIASIDAAMQAAAALPENKGKLVKKDNFWQYAGKPVTIKFLIRVDDPTVRLPLGRYVADQIEKAGIKVDRLEYDRTKCRALWGQSDPAKLGWNMYTEGWGGGGTNAFWEVNFSQMYSPWFAQMPGNNNAGFWNYTNPELDALTQACVNGRVKDSADYYAKMEKANTLGIQDSIRIWVACTTVFTCANKDRFNTRMVYGLGDGINKYSWMTADVKPDKNGAKVLKETLFSARGDLFMSAWDPVGANGCSDTYTQAATQALGDPESINNPTTGIPLPIRASWKDVKTDIDASGATIVGKIAIPADAVLWNAVDQKWESGIVYVDLKGDGTTYGYAKSTDKPEYSKAFSSATYTFKFGKWHDGREITQADYRYALSRQYDLCLNRGADDKIYDASFAGAVNPNLPRYKGYVFNKDGTITVYGDANYPMDQPSLANLLCPTLMIQASNYATFVPWEIHEAMKFLVSEGSASKTAYAFNTDGNLTEVDLISQQCVADVKAKLQELVDRKWVPAQLVGFVTPEQAVQGYKDAIAFIDAHGHAYISNGGFILDKYDPANKTAILVANRDPSYPFEKNYFTKLLTTSFARVDNIKVAAFEKGKDLTIDATISKVEFPANKAKGADNANVKVILVGDKETSYVAKAAKAGSYSAVIPAADLANLQPGSYTIIVEASLGTEAGAVKTSNVIVF
jgi:peptide/nickel transport system substrate-binding protein